ncbi:hypothetical protein ACLF8X_01275 [Helicobacter pylori]
MIGAIGALLLSGCSSYKSQGLACVDDKAMKKRSPPHRKTNNDRHAFRSF